MLKNLWSKEEAAEIKLPVWALRARVVFGLVGLV